MFRLRTCVSSSSPGCAAVLRPAEGKREGGASAHDAPGRKGARSRISLLFLLSVSARVSKPHDWRWCDGPGGLGVNEQLSLIVTYSNSTYTPNISIIFVLLFGSIGLFSFLLPSSCSSGATRPASPPQHHFPLLGQSAIFSNFQLGKSSGAF